MTALRPILIVSLLALPSLAARAAAPTIKCDDVEHYGLLNAAVTVSPAGIFIHLDGFAIGEASAKLGAPGSSQGLSQALEVTMKPEWCQVSSTTKNIFSCSLPGWPLTTVTATVFDYAGKELGTLELAGFDVSMEDVTRIIASGSGDLSVRTYELSSAFYLAADEDIQADANTSYRPQFCN